MRLNWLLFQGSLRKTVFCGGWVLFCLGFLAISTDMVWPLRVLFAALGALGAALVLGSLFWKRKGRHALAGDAR